MSAVARPSRTTLLTVAAALTLVAIAAGVGGVWASVAAQEVLQIDPTATGWWPGFGFPRGRGSR
jgi:hypothetical protein